MRQLNGGLSKGRGIGATLAFSMLLASLGTSIANIALPELAAAFDAPFHDVQGVVVFYLGAMTIVVAIAGRLGDRYGLKPMLTLGLSLFLAASIVCALAPSLHWLVAARAAQGAGAAFLMTLSTALMRRIAEPTRIGRAMGLLGTTSALGTALGPSIGGLLIPALGWRGLFWIQVPLTAAALVLSLAILPGEDRRAAGTPVRRLRAGLDGSLVPHLLLNLVVASVMMTTLVVGPFYLGLGLGLPTSLLGAVMAVGPIVSIVSGVPSGRLVDAIGSHPVLTIGLMLLALGTFLLALLPNAIGVAGYALALVVLTPGYQLFQTANTTAALAEAPIDRHATVSGLLSLSRNLGLVLGASLMGAVFAKAVGTEPLNEAGPAAIEAGMEATFLLASAMMSVATGFALRSKPASKRV